MFPLFLSGVLIFALLIDDMASPWLSAYVKTLQIYMGETRDRVLWSSCLLLQSCITSSMCKNFHCLSHPVIYRHNNSPSSELLSSLKQTSHVGVSSSSTKSVTTTKALQVVLCNVSTLSQQMR